MPRISVRFPSGRMAPDPDTALRSSIKVQPMATATAPPQEGRGTSLFQAKEDRPVGGATPSSEEPRLAVETRVQASEQGASISAAGVERSSLYQAKEDRPIGGGGLSFEQQLEMEEARLRAAGQPVAGDASAGSSDAAQAPASATAVRTSAQNAPRVSRGISALRLLKAKRRSTAVPSGSSPPPPSPSAAPLPSSAVSAFVLLKAMVRFRGKAGAAARVSPAMEPPTSVAQACERLSAAGKEDSWEPRHQALLALPALVAPLASDPDGVRQAAQTLGPPLVVQLADLRSALVRTACEVLQLLARQHGCALAPLVAHTLPQLLNNLYLLKAFAAPSRAAAAELLHLAPSTAALRALVEGSQDSHRQMRQGSLELLAVLLTHDRSVFDIPPKGLAAALGALGASKPAGRGVTDPDGATRAAAARAFWAASMHYPGKQVDAWYAALGEKEKKLVDRQRPKGATVPAASDGRAACSSVTGAGESS